MTSDLSMVNEALDPSEPLNLTPLPIEADTWRAAKDVPMSFRLILQLATRLQIGSITLVLPDGRAFRRDGVEPGPNGILLIRNYRFGPRVMKGGNIAFGESYIDGDWDSPDPSSLVEMLSRNSKYIEDVMRSKGFYRLFQRVVHLLNRNTKSGSKRNIHAHYDLGNEFYSQWLDPSMTYSSARFEKPGEDLTHAQLNKYRSLARNIGLQQGHEVLEIGCGWGGFAEFAAGEVGCKVTGITISKEQLEFAQKRIFEKGLNEKVELRFQDYRDVDEKFDRIASIEMFEAVGEEYWPSYFQKVRDSLKDGGVAGLQIITISDDFFDNYRRGTDFIQRYVFPGGMLPSISALKSQVSNVGLVWDRADAFGQDYAATLGAWRDKFIAKWPVIKNMGFDDRFQRLWKCYLSYCEGGFRSGSIDVMQISLRR